jgi:thiol-disulfide isomerase/thioredoxin
MQSQTKLLIGIGIIIFIVILFVLGGSDKNSQSATNTTGAGPEETLLDLETSETEVSSSVETEETDKEEPLLEIVPEVQPLAVGTYREYSPSAVESSDAENIVLSFYATWCPSCRTLDKDINANLSDIPQGTEIYKIDYDTNLELRKKYGVTSQHTQVVIDSNGNLIKKWVGSNTLEQFVAKI